MSKKISWICYIVIFICALMFIEGHLDKGKSSNHEQSIASENIIQITSSNFDDVVLNSGKTVLVDFYADWCPPCRALSPIIDEVADENTNENLVFTRMNVDDEEELSNRYGIQSIPTLVLIKDGQEVSRSIGYIEKEEVVEFVSQ